MRKTISPAKALRTITYLNNCARKIEKKYANREKELSDFRAKRDLMIRWRYVEFYCPSCNDINQVPLNTVFSDPSLINSYNSQICPSCKERRKKELLESWMSTRMDVPASHVRYHKYDGSEDRGGKIYSFFVGPDANTTPLVNRHDFKSVIVKVWHYQIPWKTLYRIQDDAS